MLDKLKAKLAPKSYRTPCLCGCESTVPKTIAAHQKLLSKRANVNSLGLARAAARLTGTPRLVPTKHSSHRKPQESTNPPEDYPPEDPMEVDNPQANGYDLAGPSTLAHLDPLTRVWTDRAGRREREDEDLVSEPNSPVASEDEDETGDDEDLDHEEPDFTSDDEGPPAHIEIPAGEQITADFQLHAAKAGMFVIVTIFRWPCTIRVLILCSAQEQLDPDDLDAICAFNYHITKSTTRDAFESLRHAFPTQVQNVKSLYETQRRIAELSGLKPEYSDCCVKICCCFTGSYENMDRCPFPDCREPRYDSSGKPRMRFQHLPVGPRLKALFLNEDIIKFLDYRTTRTPGEHPDSISDVFDGKLYRDLCETFVHVDGQTFDHKYFQDRHDIALGLSLDGFPIFNKRNLSAWPVILINFSLPPDIRTHLVHLLCYGVIPSPKAVKDMDSFLYPLHRELEQLAKGITSLDLRSKEMFLLRAFLLLVFGDMPAIAKVMRMKGHNGFCPCRFCEIHGVRYPAGSVYYVPLARFDGQDSYDAKALKKRTHERFLNQAEEVITAETNADEDRLSMTYGIKGIPLLSLIATLVLPLSFPFDFMHLIFENLVPNLVAHYTGNFKGLDAGVEEYIIPARIWSEICAIASASGDTIPSQFGARVPNLEKDRSHMTAEAWSFWVLYIAPIVLRNRFTKPRYYAHFMKLVCLIHLCLSYDMRANDIDTIRTGFQEWVVEYEK